MFLLEVFCGKEYMLSMQSLRLRFAESIDFTEPTLFTESTIFIIGRGQEESLFAILFQAFLFVFSLYYVNLWSYMYVDYPFGPVIIQ